LGDRIGNCEIENLGGTLQPLRMLGGLENLPAIGAFALEHAASVMQAVGKDVQIGFRPRNEFAVIPDDAFQAVVGLSSHDFLRHRRPSGAPAGFFSASALLPRGPSLDMVPSDPHNAKNGAEGRFGYDPFVLSALWVTIKPKYVNMADVNLS